jgi:membrane-bound lytic murein transglycosylase D
MSARVLLYSGMMLKWSHAQRANKYYKLIVTFLVFGTISLVWSVPTHSAYDRPVAWSDMSSLDLRSVLRSQYASQGNLYDPLVSDSTIDLVLRDADQKISKDFHIPPPLRTSVGFWLRIYTKYSTQHVVIFDSNHMDLIYEVIDLRPVFEKARNQAAFEKNSKIKVQRTLNLYRTAFLSLSRNPHPKKPTREQKVVLAKLKSLGHRHTFRELCSHLKSIRGQRDSIIKGLLAAEVFLPKMELIFSRMKVPVEIARLSLVESSFNLKALSKVGALGVWQFMPSPGNKYLMIDRNKRIDERRSPLKSTLAATQLLLWNFHHLGNWPLAIISYNHGLKNLPRLRNQKANFRKISNLFNGCTQKPLLGWASRNYYSEFLAALYAESYRTLFFGETPSPMTRSILFHRLAKRQSGLSFALERGVSLQEFQLFNTDIEDIHKPLPKGFWVAIPGEGDDIEAFVASTLNSKRKKLGRLMANQGLDE